MSHPNLQDRVTRLDCAVHHGGQFPVKPSMIVMHINDGDTFMSSVLYLNTTTDKQASYHYGIEKDGRIIRMTSPDLVAWHAGDSAWPHPVPATPDNPNRPNGGASVNHRSFGICWASKGEAITDAQIESGMWLCNVYMRANDIPVDLVRGHEEVAPGRKTDPGSAQSMDEWRALLTQYQADA